MSYLLEPLIEGKLNLKNRLVLPPMATAKCEEDGTMSQDILDYYDEKSKGGHIGLVIIEHSFVSPDGKARKRQLSVASDDMVVDLRKLSEMIHKNGSKAVMQINHTGSAASFEVTGMQAVSSSAVQLSTKEGAVLPRELTVEEIQTLTGKFRSAARRVKEAGFDGVEIHSAHGYLLNQFFSPLTNKRTDEYGGDVLHRIRFHLEVIRAIREEVGEDYPILLRLGASDYMAGGSDVEDSKIAASAFEKAGVDILDISGGFCGYTRPDASEEGYFSPLTEAIRKVVSIPVILTGGITSADAAEKLLAEKKADLIGVGRAILSDSRWPEKAIESLKA